MKYILTLLLMATALVANARTETLKSPDGNLELTFSLSEDGTPGYALSYSDREVIKPSPLGYTFRGDASAKDPKTYMRVSYDTVDMGSGFV
ncbi:MAG: glycoside hydrolase family 97 N-terminal domain-containing protein, partial [Bacteroidales bacterium]|nr:glycoside hydrolase family 97 N-terminal domain-containing protein [Bacteroidales bacterium]